jgi:hypothetical protein
VVRRKRGNDQPSPVAEALAAAETLAAGSSAAEIRLLGSSRDAKARLRALTLARCRIDLGDSPDLYFEFARSLVRDSDNNCRWQAVIVIGESIVTNPEGVWQVVAEFCNSSDDDMRAAIACVLLEHLLDADFETYFPRVREEVQRGRSWMIKTLQMCWLDGPNYQKARRFVRNANRGRPVTTVRNKK